MKIHDVQQNSLEWLMLRCGLPTASEFDQLLTPEFEIRKGEMPKTYLARKVAEAWGGPLPGYNTIDMEQGSILEKEAIPHFEFSTGIEVTRVGFVTTDDGLVGCSPDGLIGDDGGIEVKCPDAHTHVKYLLNGGLPKDYAAQVHGSMFVTGRSYWRFLSYRRGFPPLSIIVNRDEEIQAKIGAAIEPFVGRFQYAMEALEKLNGAPPKPWKANFFATPEPEPEPEEEQYGITP